MSYTVILRMSLNPDYSFSEGGHLGASNKTSLMTVTVNTVNVIIVRTAGWDTTRGKWAMMSYYLHSDRKYESGNIYFKLMSLSQTWWPNCWLWWVPSLLYCCLSYFWAQVVIFLHVSASHVFINLFMSSVLTCCGSFSFTQPPSLLSLFQHILHGWSQFSTHQFPISFSSLLSLFQVIWAESSHPCQAPYIRGPCPL